MRKAARKPTYKFEFVSREDRTTQWDPKIRKSVERHPECTITADLEVYVDWNALIRIMGRKAIYRKNGTTKTLHGAIEVRAKKIVRTPVVRQGAALTDADIPF